MMESGPFWEEWLQVLSPPPGRELGRRRAEIRLVHWVGREPVQALGGLSAHRPHGRRAESESPKCGCRRMLVPGEAVVCAPRAVMWEMCEMPRYTHAGIPGLGAIAAVIGLACFRALAALGVDKLSHIERHELLGQLAEFPAPLCGLRKGQQSAVTGVRTSLRVVLSSPKGAPQVSSLSSVTRWALQPGVLHHHMGH